MKYRILEKNGEFYPQVRVQTLTGFMTMDVLTTWKRIAEYNGLFGLTDDIACGKTKEQAQKIIDSYHKAEYSPEIIHQYNHKEI